MRHAASDYRVDYHKLRILLLPTRTDWSSTCSIKETDYSEFAASN